MPTDHAAALGNSKIPDRVKLAIGLSSVEQGACTWETRILAPARSSDEHVPLIIKSGRAEPVTDVTAVEWPQTKPWEYTKRILERAEEEGRKPTWPEVMMTMLLAIPSAQQDAPVDMEADLL